MYSVFIQSCTISVLLLFLIICIYVYFSKIKRLSNTCKQQTHVITFANHKGGVGKTTQLFFLSKYLAIQNPMVDVLIIDGSIYRDITRLFIGSKTQNLPTINDLLHINSKKTK